MGFPFLNCSNVACTNVSRKEKDHPHIFLPVSTEVRHRFSENIVKLSWIYNCVSFIYTPKAWQHLRESWHRKTSRNEKMGKHNTDGIIGRGGEQLERRTHLPWVSLPLWRTSHACKIWGGSSPVGRVCETNTGLLHSGNTKLETKYIIYSGNSESISLSDFV